MGMTISVAESCTGGMLASKLTSLPGSSEYFLGGVVTYSNDSKESILGASKDTMIADGAVSKGTAIDMAEGVRRIFYSDVSLSITGIAGPGGGTDTKPVGLVWIGLSSNNGSFAKKYLFGGDRGTIRESAVDAALDLLIEELGRIEF